MAVKEEEGSNKMVDASKTAEAVRSPLSPLATDVSRQRSLRMDNASDVSDLQQVSLFDFGESEFELMHVRVTVHALTGLLSEKERTKTKKVMATLTPKALKQKEGPMSEDSFSSTLSSSSTNNNASTCVKSDNTKTFAIASFGRNVTSSQTSIKTHLPSLPLGIPTSSFGYVYRYMAQWQEPKPVFLREEGEVDEQSSFTFLRVMMRETTGGSGEGGVNTTASKYVHETLNIEINLSRGKEIIPLGIATLAISGDEEGPHQMNIPAKAIVFKGKKAVVGSSADVKKSKRMFKKKLKRAAFPSEPNRKYFLDENATLRVTVSITPQEAINDARAKEQAKQMMRQQLEEMKKKKQKKFEEYQDENEEQYTLEECNTKTTMTTTDTKTDILLKTESSKPSTFSGLFCNAAVCTRNTEAQDKRNALCVKDNKSDDYSVDTQAFDQMVQEKYGYSLASSVLSSVSESESESDESVDNKDIHINRKILIRKHRHRTPRKSTLEDP